VGGYFSSVVEMFAAGMSRSATFKLYNPENYYSGQNYKVEQAQFLDYEHHIKLMGQSIISKFTSAARETGVAKGRG
jgi:hypothetical protein